MASKEPPEYFVTEDGAHVKVGDEIYDYYSMMKGKIIMFSGYMPDPWFSVQHTDGKIITLNGQRICTLEFAKRKGWPGA
jgi:hypothetical protein